MAHAHPAENRVIQGVAQPNQDPAPGIQAPEQPAQPDPPSGTVYQPQDLGLAQTLELAVVEVVPNQIDQHNLNQADPPSEDQAPELQLAADKQADQRT